MTAACSPPQSTSPPGQRLNRRTAAALQAAAEELLALAELGAGLQPVIGDLMARASPSAESLRRFQEIDLLVQTLQGVAHFLAALSDQASGGLETDVEAAVVCVAMSDLANRLSGRSARAGNLAVQEDGELELFA